jgi:DNA-3-methyladenine glycosylase I
VTPHPARTAQPGHDGRPRCPWAAGAGPDRWAPADYVAYHDREWGRPIHGDAALLERLVLEGFQSGLSWRTILRKRPAFRVAFAGFEPDVLAGFGAADVERLLGDAGIVRHRAKIEAALVNAAATVRLSHRDGPGALDRLVWAFAPASRPVPRTLDDVPAATAESAALARALKAEGFAFVGPTTAYATMQACGLVNDHVDGCVAR